MIGWQAEGAAPLVQGAPVASPETVASAIRIGNPASWHLAVAAAEQSGGRFGAVTDEEILTAQRRLAASEGIFVEPGSAASVAGLLQDVAAGADFAGKTLVVHRDRARPQGHRHRAVDLHRPRRQRRRGRRLRGRSRGRPRVSARVDGSGFVTGPVTVRVPATSANLGPGLRRPRAGARPDRRDHGRGPRRRRRDRDRGRRGGRRAGRGAARRDAPRAALPGGRSRGRGRARSRGCGCSAATGSRTAAAWGPPRPRSWGAWRWPVP